MACGRFVIAGAVKLADVQNIFGIAVLTERDVQPRGEIIRLDGVAVFRCKNLFQGQARDFVPARHI